MKRILLFAVLASVLWSHPSSAQAQVVDIDVNMAIAVTTCIRTDKGYEAVSVINMNVLDGPNLGEYKAHEAEHRRQFMADTSLCGEFIRVKSLARDYSEGAERVKAHWWPRVLKMEVQAYCVSARVPIKQGADPSAVYLFDQELLLTQFAGVIGRPLVMLAWFNQCGQLISGQ